MKRKTAAGALVLTILYSFIVAAGLVQLAGANFFPPFDHASSIFIKSDGSVVPSSAPLQKIGSTYVLSHDVQAGIAVEKSDVVIEGNGYALQGSCSGTGLYLRSVNNVTVRNVKVQYFIYGFFLAQSDSSVMKTNSFTNCGIVTQGSSYNQIVENTLTRGGISLQSGHDNRVIENTANGISVLFSNNIEIANNRIADAERAEVNLLYIEDNGGIDIDNSGNCSITGNVIERKTIGINIWHCTNLRFSGNTLRDNQCGIKLWGAQVANNLHSMDTSNTIDGKPVYFLVNVSDLQVPSDAGWIAAVNCRNITIQNWVSTPNYDAILFVNTSNSRIVHSNLSLCFNAIRIDSARNCLIASNQIYGNGYAAFYFEGAVECTVTENNVEDNFCFFNIWHDSEGNRFFCNNFIGNWTGSPGERKFSNFWDNGSEGNFWSTFNGTDLDGNGISDSQYLIDSYSNSVDRYPLMAFVAMPEVPEGENQAETKPLPTMSIAAASIVLAALATAVPLLFLKKRRGVKNL